MNFPPHINESNKENQTPSSFRSSIGRISLSKHINEPTSLQFLREKKTSIINEANDLQNVIMEEKNKINDNRYFQLEKELQITSTKLEFFTLKEKNQENEKLKNSVKEKIYYPNMYIKEMFLSNLVEYESPYPNNITLKLKNDINLISNKKTVDKDEFIITKYITPDPLVNECLNKELMDNPQNAKLWGAFNII
jgi:hypothetical protein